MVITCIVEFSVELQSRPESQLNSVVDGGAGDLWLRRVHRAGDRALEGVRGAGGIGFLDLSGVGGLFFTEVVVTT